MKRIPTPASFSRPCLFALMAVVFLVLFAGPAFPATPQKTIGETFLGERLSYDIGFWFFERVAVAELTLEREEGGYRAVLRAHTTGFVDRVIQHRSDVYTAHLREVEGGRRFLTLSLESVSDVNGKVRRSMKEVDISRGILKKHSWGGGKEERKEEVRFTPGTYVDDPLAGFYNFRFGVYGSARPGVDYAIRTFPHEDYKDEKIHMRLSAYSGGEEEGRVSDRKIGYSARVQMSKDVFGTDLADIDILFSTDLIPLRASARDIVLFTDVWGTLVK